jgi:SAM-dependent methyltransferase
VTRITALALAGLLALPAGDIAGRAADDDKNVTIIVPDYGEYPEKDPPRLYSLKIDGKDFTRPKPEPKSRMMLKVAPQPGKDTVEFVMSFYPVAYSKTVRTKRVKMKAGDKVTVDFTKEDRETPDWYEPIFYPSPRSLMLEICKFAKVSSKDTVMDIGCGDGRLVITAVKDFKAKKGIGLDIKPELVKLCKENAEKAFVSRKTEFRVEDALKMKSVADIDVVFIYLGEDLSARLEPLLRKTLKPGARVVSLDFPIGKWKEDMKKEVVARSDRGKEHTYTLFLWTIRKKD